jgi:hypothetical protein
MKRRKPGRAVESPAFNVAAHEDSHLPRILVYTSKATLSTDASTGITPPRGGRIVAGHANVAGAPSGGNLTVDVKVGGTSVMDSQYITVLDGETTSGVDSNTELFDEPRTIGEMSATFRAFESIQVQIVAINGATGPMVVQLEIDWED